MLIRSASKGRKSYYYYYPCFKNCGTRHKAKEVNEAFIREMNEYRPKPGYEEFYTAIIKQAFKLNASGDLHERRRKVRTARINEIVWNIALINRKLKEKKLD